MESYNSGNFETTYHTQDHVIRLLTLDIYHKLVQFPTHNKHSSGPKVHTVASLCAEPPLALATKGIESLRSLLQIVTQSHEIFSIALWMCFCGSFAFTPNIREAQI